MDHILYENYKTSAGKEQARLLNKIVAGEATLVRSCVWKVLGRANRVEASSDVEDLFQVGCISLLAAVKMWDREKGPWAPYARKWVTEDIRRAMPEQSLIRVPNQSRHILTREQMMEIVAIRARTGREATAQEIGVSEEVLAEWRTPAVCTTAVGDDTEDFTRSAPSPDLAPDMVKALNSLDPQSQRVVMGFAVEGKTFEEIGKEEGFTKQWGRVLFENATQKMRAYLAV